MTSATIETWALPRLQQLLPLDNESLRQVLTYTLTLDKPAAAEHLKDILGDSAPALEFIASFNLRRQNVPSARAASGGNDGGRGISTSASNSPLTATTTSAQATGNGSPAPASKTSRTPKKKTNIHELPARQIRDQGVVTGAYRKSGAQDEYIPRQQQQRRDRKTGVADRVALQEETPRRDNGELPLIIDDPTVAPTTSSLVPTATATNTKSPLASSSRAPPSAAGSLISDRLAPKKTSDSRKQSPAPIKATVNLAGGQQMRGASGAMSDLDAAIRALELQTNPNLVGAADDASRRCDCMATRHPLLEAAPNCLNCGQIVCVKQGLGPCTFCGKPLLSNAEINAVLRVLRDDGRGNTDRPQNNDQTSTAHAKGRTLTGREFLASTRATPVSSSRASPLSSRPATPSDEDGSAAAGAKAHRDRLLAFQAENARRTTVHDEAADFDIPTSGTSMWASPAERAAQLKKQQRMLREMQFNAKPEYEKRRVVASIDVVKGKVVKTMAPVERPPDDNIAESGDSANDANASASGVEGSSKHAFSNNPLAKGLVRPKARVAKSEQDGSSTMSQVREKPTTWRRVQMDEDDNEMWILDGGARGGLPSDADLSLGAEEHAFG